MNIKHQSIFTGDNLPILRGINSGLHRFNLSRPAV